MKPMPHDPHAAMRGQWGQKDRWSTPALVVALLGVLFIVAVIFFMPRPGASRDFRQDGSVAQTGDAAGFERIAWSRLIPAGWDASEQMRQLQARQTGVADDDPRARTALTSLRELLDAAPSDPALDGRQVEVPGYVVPLDRRTEGVSEFLLVPYFGACIHTPPPPANQVIHVTTDHPMKELRAMDPVWVRGTLSAGRSDTAVAVSGYRMLAVSAVRYEPTESR